MDPYRRLQSQLDRDLLALRDNVLRLSDMVDSAIGQSIQALRKLDSPQAQDVIQNDEAINRSRFEIEQECYRILALQQPTARDMRAVVTAIHIAVELERMADHAVGIAKLTQQLADTPLPKPLRDIPKMSEVAREMLRASLDAYLNWDAKRAEETLKRDDEVDELNNQVYHELVKIMLDDSNTITRATYLLWIAHNLERIADRITNICERIVFMVTGELVREEVG